MTDEEGLEHVHNVAFKPDIGFRRLDNVGLFIHEKASTKPAKDLSSDASYWIWNLILHLQYFD